MEISSAYYYCMEYLQYYKYRKLGNISYDLESMDLPGYNTIGNSECSPDAMSQADVMSIWNYLKPYDDQLGNNLSQQNEDLYYPLWAYPKGFYLIINIIKVKGLKNRYGAAKDEENLISVFDNLGLKVSINFTSKFILFCILLQH